MLFAFLCTSKYSLGRGTYNGWVLCRPQAYNDFLNYRACSSPALARGRFVVSIVCLTVDRNLKFNSTVSSSSQSCHVVLTTALWFYALSDVDNKGRYNKFEGTLNERLFEKFWKYRPSTLSPCSWRLNWLLIYTVGYRNLWLRGNVTCLIFCISKHCTRIAKTDCVY